MGAVARKKQKKKKGYCTIQQLKQAFYILKGMADNLNTPRQEPQESPVLIATCPSPGLLHAPGHHRLRRQQLNFLV